MLNERGPLTRCEVPYCKGYTRLRRRVAFGTYLCYRHKMLVPEDVWEEQERALGSFVRHRAWWFRCVEIAIERAL